MRKKSRILPVAIMFAALGILLLSACGQNRINTETLINIAPEIIPLTEFPAVFAIPSPTASGTSVQKNDNAEIDYSNAQDGYIMVKFLKNNQQNLKVLITGPSGTQYQYNLNKDGKYDVFPLSDGNGKYSVSVCCQKPDSTKYALVLSASVDAELRDEFAPFIRPNQYVNYTKDSETVKKAAELVIDCDTLTGKIAAIYNFTIKNISYDKELAANVTSGYLPDVDAVLEKGRGICFDYAAVMTAMLRSQGIPAKLVIGYTGDVYHTWINAYSKETGWVDTVVYFDGKSWKLMDPTFDSTGGQSSEVREYIGDGSNYTAKYLY